jgi:alanyl-tRNA synthetase
VRKSASLVRWKLVQPILRIYSLSFVLPKQTILDGHKAFDLYATYGLPLEISRDIAREQGLDVDEAGFNEAKETA